MKHETAHAAPQTAELEQKSMNFAGMVFKSIWIIPTAANTMPLPNPICPPPQIDKIVEPIRVVRDAIPEFPWWLLALVAVVVVGRKKR